MNTLSLVCGDVAGGDALVSIFDFSIAPALLFYAYVPAIALVLLLGIYVLRSDSKFRLPNNLFFLTTLFFILYLINDTVQWIAVPVVVVHFSWQLILLIKSLLLLTCFYFVYTFVEKRDMTSLMKISLTLLFLPVTVLLPTSLNIAAFNLSLCQADSGVFYFYVYLLEGVVLLLIVLQFIRHYSRQQSRKEKMETISVTFGAIAFILFIFATDFIGEYTGSFEILMIAPLGMLIFLALIAFIIVRYNTFNAKLLGAQALIITIIFLVGSQLFFIKSHINFVLTSATLTATVIAGYFLVRSVKREVKQREEIQSLVGELAKTNKRLQQLDKLKSEFVSIASHQLRSPLAAIMGYSSMLGDGSYGKLPAKAEEIVERIVYSAKLMGASVEDYLNVSRIESGNMKYNLSDFNLKDQAERVAEDIRPIALKKNIIMLFRTSMTGQGVVNADPGKTEQILHNLINNSLKYTEKGNITVVARDNVQDKKLYIDITDSGIGMSDETLASIFQKFERGSNANTTNIHGTGLGLFTAAKLAEAMGGNITAHSEGEGKGSRFTIEFPLVA